MGIPLRQQGLITNSRICSCSSFSSIGSGCSSISSSRRSGLIIKCGGLTKNERAALSQLYQQPLTILLTNSIFIVAVDQ